MSSTSASARSVGQRPVRNYEGFTEEEKRRLIESDAKMDAMFEEHDEKFRFGGL